MAQRVPVDLSFKLPIRQLTEDNYTEWHVDIRALLRKQKLWIYTQKPPPQDLSATQLIEWIEGSQEAADTIIPTISRPVKLKLKADDFNDGYKMFSRISAELQPTGDREFIRLTKEYYSIRWDYFASEKKPITAYLQHIKLLEEKIRATNVILTPDKQTLICLAMSLPEKLQYLTDIWAITPEMTADKAWDMLLEEERKGFMEEKTQAFKAAAVGNSNRRRACRTCNKQHGPVCWMEHPDKAPEWYQDQRTRKRQRSDTHVGFAFSC